MLRAADVLIVNQRASVGDMAFPSKLTSYFPAGRPVIGAVRSDSDAADELRASGSGIVVEPEDPDALVGAIAALRADPRRARQLGQAGNFYANRELMPDRALSEYDAFLADIVAPR
jgi:glycosyltransferase involved in cell wall biosynthesis